MKVSHLKTKRSLVFLVLKERKISHIMDLFMLATNAGNPSSRQLDDFPVDITCVSQFLFVNIDILVHQNVGDVRAPIIKILESERRFKNGSVNTVKSIHDKSYKNLDYKPIPSNNIQNIQAELRNETEKIIHFTGTAKNIVSLKFQKNF